MHDTYLAIRTATFTIELDILSEVRRAGKAAHSGLDTQPFFERILIMEKARKIAENNARKATK